MSYRRKTTAAEDRAMSGSTITVLSAWMAIVSAINIQLIPENPVIQSSVTLNVTGIIGKILTILWCKGPNTNSENHILTYLANDDSPIIVGDKYFTRVQAFSNGSLAITNLSVHDGGQYMVKIQTQIAPDQASIDFRVYDGSECSTCGTNTAAISGVACAAVLIIAILLSICFLLYKKCVHPVHDIPSMYGYKGSPYEREDPCVIYDNVLELTPARNIQPYSTQRSKEEPAYMVLQYASESHYNEINR
ncbi:uncharacterized protein [Aquarana catesbeiana]|uniref:uncharacterized protein isoform X4 n=1 Tax=Aquarana catesbeiana TaxID=8400 RepID=UPI003CC92AEB